MTIDTDALPPGYGHFGMKPDHGFANEADFYKWLMQHFALVQRTHPTAKLSVAPHGKFEITVGQPPQPYRTFHVGKGKEGKLEVRVVRGRA